MYGTGTGECTVCTVLLVAVYGTVYGICVKPPWPPCICMYVYVVRTHIMNIARILIPCHL